MLILKLIVITLFLFFSSKAIGIILKKKINLKNNEYIGLGYLTNISFFFLSVFIVMLLKLSTVWMMIFGSLYFVFCIYCLFVSIKRKELFKFSKVEILSLGLTLVMMIIYALVINFGYLETYDTYFYSLLTENASNTNHISSVDPYTGLSNLQNFYKYISFYYQPSYYANLLGISDAYLVLIWPMAFMNYLFAFLTAFTICRISDKPYINNILSLFTITLIPNMFRAPFNALHIYVAFIAIYCFKYIFDYLNGEDDKLWLLLICFISGIAISSTALFTLVFFILIIALALTIKKETTKYIKLLYLSIPISLLGFLYLYESLANYLVLLIWGLILALLFYLFKKPWFLTFLTYTGRAMIIILGVLFFVIPHIGIKPFITKYFLARDSIQTEIQNKEDEIVYESCFVEYNPNFTGENILEIDNNRHSTSMNLVYNNNSNIIDKVTTMLSHSVFIYGGLLFLFLYGLFYLKKDLEYVSFILYMLLIFNPITRDGIETLTFGLARRIIIFFNTFYALLGMKYFFNFIKEFIKGKKYEMIVEKILKYSYIGYAILVIVSLSTYIYAVNLNNENISKYNLLYKTPSDLENLNYIVDKDIEKSNYSEKPKVFFSASVFNLSLLDNNIENKYKFINSKTYMEYFKSSEISNLIIIDAFFETGGRVDVDKIFIPTEDIEEKVYCKYDIITLIDVYDINYFIIPYIKDDDFQKFIITHFEILKENNNIQILKRGSK